MRGCRDRTESNRAISFGGAMTKKFTFIESHFRRRIEVMRAHLERVFRYDPARARRVFRDAFDEVEDPALLALLEPVPPVSRTFMA